jgi:hypothetical protein
VESTQWLSGMFAPPIIFSVHHAMVDPACEDGVKLTLTDLHPPFDISILIFEFYNAVFH